MAVREHECHCREHAHFAVLVHQGERVSKACEGNLLKHTTDSALHTDALHTFTSVAFRRGCHHKEMVMGVPEGPWASYCMLDDNFEDPTTAELCQAHIRTDLLALHPCRGQWVRDAKGRLGVLAADKDWRNDPLYNFEGHNGVPANGAATCGAPANGGAAGGAQAPENANAHAQGAGGGLPHVIDLTESDDDDVILMN